MSFLNDKRPTNLVKSYKILDYISILLLAIGTFLIPLFYLPYTNDIFNLPKQLLLSVVVLLGLLLWLLKVVITKKFVLKRTILDIPILFFALFLIISAVVSQSALLSFLGKTDNFVMHTTFLLSLLLWFWLFIQCVRKEDFLEILYSAFLLAGSLTGLFFLLRNSGWLQEITAVVGSNMISQVNSEFGIYMAAVAITALGFLLLRRRRLILQILPFVSAVIAVTVLIKLGFTISWIVFAVGLGLLLVLGISLLAETRTIFLSIVLVLFLISILTIFVGTPKFLKANLPLEVALGVRPSWDVTYQTIVNNAKNFMFGSGPGTFIYDFSRFRSPAFNTSQVAWSTRFDQPYSTVLALLAELGVVGFLSFMFILLLLFGSIFSVWIKTRPSTWGKIKEKVGIDSEAARQYQAFIPAFAWLATTVGLFLSFYGIVAWWLWFWLLSVSIVSLSFVHPGLIHKKNITLEVSPQYSFAISFGMVLVFTLLIVFGAFNIRYYLAEVAYAKAIKASNIEVVEQNVQKAIEYRPSYPQYHLTLAKINLQKARNLSEQETANSELIMGIVATAVNEAKRAADEDPNNVQTWDVLSLMYMNVRTFASDANSWALDALQKAIILESSNPIFQWRLANVYVFAGQAEEAVKAYKKAIELKPDYFDAYKELALLYEQQQDLDAAIMIYEPIMPVVQNNAVMLFDLGRLFYNRAEEGDNARAEVVWQRAIELEPNYSNALYSLGLLYEKRGDKQTAVQYYEKVNQLNPDNPDIGKKIKALLAPPSAPPAPTEPVE